MILQIRNMTGGYTHNHDILQGVDLDVQQGESVGIIGLNGSGKSTFAKAIMNMLPYRQGEIFFNGEDITKKSPQELSESGIALFMQGGRVFDELTVWENLTFSAKKTENIAEIQEYFLLLRVAIAQLKKMRADKLSGGERHQLALAMCVLKEPHLLILDEPSAGLAPHAVNEMYQTLETLRKKKKLTIILIEQNVSKALNFCSSVKMLRNGKITYSSEESPMSGGTMSPPENQLKEIEKIMFNN